MSTFTPTAIALATAATLLVGCSGPGDSDVAREPATGTVTIYTVNYPLKYFADRIGGEHVDVVFPASPDEDPAFWLPDAATVSTYQQADLILLNGATYAKWVRKVTLPESKLVNTTKAIKGNYIAVAGAITHSHGSGQQHSHQGTAFTTWLDPEIAIAQAEAVRQALVKLRPTYKAAFQRGFESLKSDLEALDVKLAASLEQASQQPVIFSHPVFQYLTRKYGLNAKSVHWEPDAVPNADKWAAFEEVRKDHPAEWMIWEGEPLTESLNQLSERGVESVVFNPCGNTPADGDWLQVMNRNAESLAHVFSTTATD